VLRKALQDLVPVKRCSAIAWNGRPVAGWKEFHKRVSGRNDLLRELPSFQSPILVAGCQRSGTTLLTRLISRGEAMAPFSFSDDDELDAALILSGLVSIPNAGRFCFQTTYLDANFHEYFTHKGRFKLIWVLRNPFSVVFSMVHNWRPNYKVLLKGCSPGYPLDSLFRSCGWQAAPSEDRKKSGRPWPFGLGRARKAAYAYVGKNSQALELREKLTPNELMIVEYDDLVLGKDKLLPAIFEWLGVPYSSSYAEGISPKGLRKSDKLSPEDRAFIERTCVPLYERISELKFRI